MPSRLPNGKSRCAVIRYSSPYKSVVSTLCKYTFSLSLQKYEINF